MNKKIISIFAILVVAVAIVGFVIWDYYGPINAAYFAYMLPQTPLELAEKADYAIVGKVIDMKPIRVQMPTPGDNDVVFTVITLDVKKDIFQNYGDDTIIFRIVGGEADNMKLEAGDEPKFHLGEKVLVYLGVSTSKEYPFYGENFLMGGAQGALEVDDKTGKSTVKSNGKSYDTEKLYKDSKDVHKNKDKK